jgi:hypothetical protein
VKKKQQKPTLACKGDTLPAILVWFHHNLAGCSNSNSDFLFRSVRTPVVMALTHSSQLIEFITTTSFAVFEEKSVKGSYGFRVISGIQRFCKS